MRVRAFAVLAVLILLPPAARASCGSASCPLDLNALNAPPQGGFSLDLSFQYIDQDRVRGTSDFVPEHAELRTVNRSATLLLRYAPSDRLQLSVSTPYLARTHQHVHDGEAERWQLDGAGDVQLQARGRITPHVWLIGGVKLPTGGDSDRNDEGERAEVTIQPGSGSTDFIGGVAYENGLRFGSITYRRNGRGALDHRVGNEWQLNGGTSRPLTRRLEALLQANVRRRDRDVSPDDPQDAVFTGGTYAFLSPGIRFNAGRGALYALVQLPVYQHVNGIQLVARRNWIGGVQTRF